MGWVLSVAKLFCPDVFKIAKNTNKIQVVTIAMSHYCEMACWALEAGKIKFDEQAYSGGQHVLPTMVVRIGGPKKYLCSTSKMSTVKVETSKESDSLLEKKKPRPNPASVPVAVLPDGSVLCDSWDIAAYSGLTPIDPELKTLLDEEMGTLSRQMAYVFVLKPSNTNIFNQLFTEGTHWSWRLLFYFAGSKIRSEVIKKMKPYDEEANKQCREKLEKVVKTVGERIKSKTTPFLGGNSIGVSDIALASLMAPLLSPPEYIHGKFGAIFDAMERQDKEVSENLAYWRSTVAGEYVMNLYKNHRNISSSSST